MADDCIFCKIVRGDIPAKKLYEDDQVIAFHDMYPAAPVHFLVVPKEHIATLDDVDEKQGALMSHMLLTGTRLARELGISKTGYRQVINCHSDGGQVVFHLHMHIIGGRPMGKMG